MSTSYGQFTFSHGGNRPRTAPVLWGVGLALMLAASLAPAAPGD